MTQFELIKALAEEMGVMQMDARATLDALFAIIINQLKTGDVVYTPLGTFSVKQIEGRNGTNPRTHAPIHINGRNKVKFTETQALREAVN